MNKHTMSNKITAHPYPATKSKYFKNQVLTWKTYMKFFLMNIGKSSNRSSTKW